MNTREGVLVRDARAADVEAVTAIYAHHVLHGTASFELEPPPAAEIAVRRERVLAAGFPYLVATLDGVVSGYAYASAYRPRPAYRWCVEDSVYVAPAALRGGVGGALLGALVERCTAAGYRQMIAVIGGDHHRASIELHLGHGFAHAGTLASVGFKHGRWHDTVLMQRALGPGAGRPPGV